MTVWTEDRIATLTMRWLAGATGQVIAEEMGTTRNAILGQVNRLGLIRQAVERPKRRQQESGEMLRGVRKAYASKGDDSTLTRFVKVDGARRHSPRKSRLPGFELEAVQEGRTKFTHARRRVDQVPHILVSGHNNIKIGRDVRKGKLKGYWIYYATLEERLTCPDTCKHWESCYGNNMPFAKRVDHTDPNLIPALEMEVAKLCAQATRRGSGILIRLHALGDFFSIDYADFWSRMLATYPNLALYGYTARMPQTPIGERIFLMNILYGERCFIRFSDGGMASMSTVSIGGEASAPPSAIICPEQTCKSRCCATCALCWTTEKNIAFMEH